MLLNDRAIRDLIINEGLIQYAAINKVREVEGSPVLSFGVGSFGYDIRLAPQFKFPIADPAEVIDPKRPNERRWVDLQLDPRSGPFILPGNSFVLGQSVEYFQMPPDVLGLVLGKSSYARCGIIFNFTPLEPGWEGHITIEIGNLSGSAVPLYAFEGCAQVLFFKGEKPQKDYGSGPYQNQRGITLSSLKGLDG